MTDSRILATETERNVLLYLKSQQVLSGDVDVWAKDGRLSGNLQIRKGQVVAAACEKLVGNGALLSLAAIRDGEIQTAVSLQPVEHNVALSLSLVERLLSKLPSFSQADKACDAEQCLEKAIRLIHQFRRTEAGEQLVEVLRSNRFYYPAWLWHSRLMTREDYIKKALTEARKWGNCDPAIGREIAKIEPQLKGGAEPVKRCIFCWSLIGAGEVRCKTCQGVFRIVEDDMPGGSSSVELTQSLQEYHGEFLNNPKNTRIAYCLFLGHYSLGNIDQARKFISKALEVSPKEPIFTRAAALLDKKVPLPAATPPPVAVTPVIPVVSAPQPVNPPVETVSGASKSILVVEDSPTSRKVISMLLCRKGYTIIEAKSGGEALQKWEEKVPDLVLLDVMLPDMTGYEVLARLRQDKKSAEIPVVMLTGKTNPSDRLKGLYHGSNEYLTKPFDPAKLLAVLEKYLEQPVPSPSPRETSPPPRPQQAQRPAAAPSPSPPKQRVVVKMPAAQKKTEPAIKGGADIPKKAPVVKTPSPPPVTSAAPVAAKATGGKANKTVLVVEDSPTSRKVITMVLAKRGYTIEEAATGGAALRRLEGELPNLILLDAMLPDMTGYDILSRLKHDGRLKDVPVVMLTAKNNPMDRQKGLRGGSVAYLTKPFDPEKLLTVIDEHI
ncbi:MAG: response regulator [Desulforhopalus sp.]|nr:response regulator [Desulforhopalus sp.]